MYARARPGPPVTDRRRWSLVAVVLAVLGALWMAGPAAPGALAGPVQRSVIYDDALAPGWQDWSWDSSVDLRATVRPLRGRHVIRFWPRQPYGGLYLRRGAPIALAGGQHLVFAARATAAGQRYSLVLYGPDGRRLTREVSLSRFGGQPRRGVWKRYRVPTSVLAGRRTAFSGFAIEESTGRPRGSLLVDEVALVGPRDLPPATSAYPWHRDVVATVFWIGEPKGNGSSEDNAISAYDDAWLEHYGGYDNPWYRRSAGDDYFPREFEPKENPFYLDLPYDDINVSANLRERSRVIPWARGLPDPGPGFSYMKNRWVRLRRDGRTCYGQIQDAGPYVYNDARYVFGSGDERPASKLANGAGLDVSPALRDCLRFTELNGASDRVDWQFVEAEDVPDGPWKRVVTTRGVYQP